MVQVTTTLSQTPDPFYIKPSKDSAVLTREVMENGITDHSTVIAKDSHHTTDISLQSSDLSQTPNPSLQVSAHHTIQIAPAPIQSPLADEVLIHIKASGICGSDIHFWKSGCIGSLKVHSSYILGHEAAGVVVRLGANVTDLAVGDRVAIEPGVPCETCFLCRDGRYNLCEEVRFAGVYPHNGTVQRLKCHPAKWVHKMPDRMSFAQGALLEPLSVVLHAISSVGTLRLGRPALIQGAGPIGLIALEAARASGACPIVITDVAPERLAFAHKFVPSCETYLVQRHASAEENAENVRALFGVGRRGQDGVSKNEYDAPAVVLECTGVESSVATAAYSCRRGGTVMVVGVGRTIMNNLPFMHLSLAEVCSFLSVAVLSYMTTGWSSAAKSVSLTLELYGKKLTEYSDRSS